MRAGLIVPLRSGGTVIGALVATSLAADVYDARHLTLARQVADHIAPAVDNAVLRRRERLAALEELPVILGATLNVKEVFDRVAERVRPAMDFDVMGAGIVAPNGRDVDVIAEVNPGDEDIPPTAVTAGVGGAAGARVPTRADPGARGVVAPTVAARRGSRLTCPHRPRVTPAVQCAATGR